MKRLANVRNSKGSRRWRTAAMLASHLAAACVTLKAGTAIAADTPTGSSPPVDFSQMSLEDLANVEISSVSKRPERLSNAAASVFVITREDIRRSGYTSIPELLRLAPNLQVARVDASQYAISSRGFNSTTANKLLMLIDGRSTYTPLYSGVFWDAQDTLIEDIERIEVISGPGGTLWGANAVNGVINVITRKTQDTVGNLVSLGAGSGERSAGVRHGGQLDEDVSYRIYAKGSGQNNTHTASGSAVSDAWNNGRVGFRIDGRKSGNNFTLQGDAYDGVLDQAIGNDKKISGTNLLARWNRVLENDSSLQVQAYFDQNTRVYPGTFSETLKTYDLEVQHSFTWRGGHQVLWGGGYRANYDAVINSAGLAFLPADKKLSLANVFVQDSIALSDDVRLTLGAKLEHNNYTGLEFQPNVRLAWELAPQTLLWSAISRAVRTPSRLDRELFSPARPPFLLNGGANFQSEKLTAYELGFRAQPTPKLSYSVTAFYHVYDELRSLEAAPGGGLPVTIGNEMKGHTYGVEMWGNYRLTNWWRLGVGVNTLRKHLGFKPGSRDLSGVQAAGNDSDHQFSLRSTMNLANNVELDLGLRSISSLPSPALPGYTALDARLGWHVSKDVEVSLAAFNLLDKGHPEFGSALTRSEIGRRFFAKIVWKF
jgi:iron complex outermembrane receptor protein